MKIVNNLDRLMWERKISAAKLAELSGVSAAKILMIRHNPEDNMTKETMEKICTALKIGLNELVTVKQESQSLVTV